MIRFVDRDLLLSRERAKARTEEKKYDHHPYS